MKDEMLIDGVRYIITTHFDENATQTVEDLLVMIAVDKVKSAVVEADYNGS
jgi:hypothetical protein